MTSSRLFFILVVMSIIAIIMISIGIAIAFSLMLPLSLSLIIANNITISNFEFSFFSLLQLYSIMNHRPPSFVFANYINSNVFCILCFNLFLLLIVLYYCVVFSSKCFISAAHRVPVIDRFLTVLIIYFQFHKVFAAIGLAC